MTNIKFEKNSPERTTFFFHSKCTAVSRLAEVLCEQNRCLQEQSLIDEVNSISSLNWRAQNYSEFWGKRLSEGVKLRLGTLNPSNSVSECNTIPCFFHSIRASFLSNHPIVNKGLQNEFGAAGVRSRVPASGIRRQNTLEAADLGRGRSGLVRRFLGHFHGASRLGQIRRDEQGHRQRPPQRATFALVQQERATRLRRRLLGQSLAVHAKIRVIFPHRIFHKIDNKNDNNKIDDIPVFFFFFPCHSLVDEQCYPWKGVYEQCKLQKRTNLEAAGCRAPANPLRKELYKVGPAYRLGNETDIMREILTSGPVQGEYTWLSIVYLLLIRYEIRITLMFQPP